MQNGLASLALTGNEEIAPTAADSISTTPNSSSNSATECGHVIDCDGERAIVSVKLSRDNPELNRNWYVGQLVSVQVGSSRIIGLTYKVDVPATTWDAKENQEIRVHLELLGEISQNSSGEVDFSSGIASYPRMGCTADHASSHDLATIYANQGSSIIKIGSLTQDQSVEAKIDLDKLLSRHFAVVGTTGVGKSTAVSLLLRKVVEKRPDVRVMILDPHNEFTSTFHEHAITIDATKLKLPFWLFKLDEFAEVVFRGQKGLEVEAEVLRDLIPLAKDRYNKEVATENGMLKRRASRSNITADMPVPYRIVDLLKLVEDRLGLLDGKQEKPILKSLKQRLESISNDPRFRFMFESGQGGDIMESIVSTLFRVPQNGKPICVLEMSALPTEVVNSVVSVLCRMAFDLGVNSDGGIQTLVVCEEAHRYIPADENTGFWPTRNAIARIAKEGRKYGVYLGIVTQRPGELDPTILSQCNTIFSMRLGNQKDQDIIRGAVTNGAKSTINFLSSIANRECIAFGEAVHTPMRLTFETIDSADLPGARIYQQQNAVKSGVTVSLSAILKRMRMEDRPEQDDDVYSGSTKQPVAGQKLSNTSLNANPGEDINSILNAVYTPQAGNSLKK